MFPTFKGVRAGVHRGTNIAEKGPICVRKPDPILQWSMLIATQRKNVEEPAKFSLVVPLITH